jgi:hypothetical protein
MLDTAKSRGGVLIRLTPERWSHIVEEHAEMAGMRLEVIESIEHPDRVISGKEGALMATREYETGRHLVVVYRELRNDGFVITAFSTTRAGFIERRKQIWP